MWLGFVSVGPCESGVFWVFRIKLFAVFCIRWPAGGISAAEAPGIPFFLRPVEHGTILAERAGRKGKRENHERSHLTRSTLAARGARRRGGGRGRRGPGGWVSDANAKDTKETSKKLDLGLGNGG